MRLNLPDGGGLLPGPALSPAARLSQPAERAFETYIRRLETRLAAQHAGPDTYLPCWLGRGRRGGCGAGIDRRRGPGGAGQWRKLAGERRAFAPLARRGTGSRGQPARSVGALAGLQTTLPGITRRKWSPPALLTDDGESGYPRHAIQEAAGHHGCAGRGIRGPIGTRRRQTRLQFLAQHAHLASRPARIGPGASPPEGADDGFLWRLNSYWSFEQRREGLFMECEAVSLTRDVPAGLGWLIMPIIETLPRASLEFTLTATKNALANATRRRTMTAQSEVRVREAWTDESGGTGL